MLRSCAPVHARFSGCPAAGKTPLWRAAIPVPRTRGAADHRVRRHIMPYARLCIYRCPFVNGQVAGRSGLASHGDVLPQGRAAGKSGLSTDDVVFANNACVPDLNKAVDLSASLHASFANRCAIDGGQRLNLNVIFDHGDARLDDFELGPIVALANPNPSPPTTTPLCSVTRSPMGRTLEPTRANER